MSDKEQVVANLIASSTGGGDAKKKVLIEEVGSPTESSGDSTNTNTSSENAPTQHHSHPPAAVDEGPSLMEQMMAAQQQAKKKDDAVKAKARSKEAKKGLGAGFKKGFFDGGGNSSKAKKSTKKQAADTTRDTKTETKTAVDSIPTLSGKKAGAKGGSSNGAKGVVLDDVQRALKEEQEARNNHPMLQQLKGGEWATDDLMQRLQSDPVLSAGLQSTKCQAALQLMQTDPLAAKKKFEHDPEVAQFMQAFSALMAGHFTQLGKQQEQQQSQQQPAPLAGAVDIPEGQMEIGPLHAAAMARQKQQQKEKKGGGGVISEVNREEEARVKEVVQDEELRSMLLDPALQRVLQECNDPHQFQRHMRDPVTAYKIKKLFDAGLVGTAK